MHKGAQSKQDFLRRVGNHATKGHGSNGLPMPGTRDWDLLPMPEQMSLDEMKDQRDRLLRMEGKMRGRANQLRCSRIGLLNTQIKRLNIEVNDRYHARVLYRAIEEVCDEKTREAILTCAREIRIGDEG